MNFSDVFSRIALLVALTFIYQSKTADANEESDLVCSVPRSDLPAGIPIFERIGAFYIKLKWAFGSNAMVFNKTVGVCNASVFYELNNIVIEKNLTDLKNTDIITVRGLQNITMYRLKWHMSYKQSETDITNSTTKNTYVRTISSKTHRSNITVTLNDKKGILKILNLESNTCLDFSYSLYWKPKSCSSDLWRNATVWKDVDKCNKKFLVDVSHIFYSKITVSVSIKMENFWLKSLKFHSERNATEIPDNAILNILFSNGSLIVDVEKNCYKQNGPELNLHYELRPIENPKLINNVTIGTIETKQERNDKWRFTIKEPLFHNTKYELSVSFDPAMTNSKKLVYITPSSAPHDIRNLSLCYSSDGITVIWKKPKRFPPTGTLEKFVIKTDRSTPKFEVMLSECKEWCQKEIKLEASTSGSYDVEVLAYNVNVTEPSKTSKIFNLPSYNKLEKPSSVTLTKRNSSSLLVSIGQDDCYSDLHSYVINVIGSQMFNKTLPRNEVFNKISSVPISNLTENQQYSIKIQSCDEKQKFCSDWSEPKIMSTTPNFEPLYRLEKYGGKVCLNQLNWTAFILYEVENGKENFPLESELPNCDKGIKEVNKRFKMIRINRSGGCYNLTLDREVIKFRFTPVVCLGNSSVTDEWIYDSSRLLELKQPMLSNQTLILIGVFVPIVILVLGLFFLFRYLKNRPADVKKVITSRTATLRKGSARESDSTKKLVESVEQTEVNEEEVTSNPVTEVQYVNAFSDSEITNISINELVHYIRNRSQVEYNFKSVPYFVQGLTCSDGESQQNLRKNRYKNNLPYNETRVILPQIRDDPTSDYINASYVNIPNYEQKLIATQGPKDSGTQTINDFYRMIWHCRPSHIVMIANLVENGKKKVGQYWPRGSNPVLFGNIQVTLIHEEIKKYFVIRVLEVQKGNKSIQVVQYQFTSWPDHGTPSNPYSFTHLAIRVLKEYTFEAPIVVHCSAGIGRTGTFLLVLVIMKQLEHKGMFDFKSALWSLRKGRPKLIENASQFYFGHELVLEILKHRLRTKDVQSFSRELVINNSMLQDEFENIQKLRNQVGNNTYQWTLEHPEVQVFNRSEEVIPDDAMIRTMTNSSYAFEAQYFNAVKISHDNLEDFFIVTEHPMANTIDRFWQYVMGYGISNVILMNYFDGSDEEFPNILPVEGEILSLNEGLILRITSDVVMEDNTYVQVYQVEVATKDQSMEPHRCQVLQLLNWDQSSEVPSSNEGLLFILEKLRPYSGCPTIITCSDGVTASCWMATLLTGLRLLDTTCEINVHSVALNTITIRPQAIISKNQYDYLYQTISNYIDQYFLPSY